MGRGRKSSAKIIEAKQRSSRRQFAATNPFAHFKSNCRLQPISQPFIERRIGERICRMNRRVNWRTSETRYNPKPESAANWQPEAANLILGFGIGCSRLQQIYSKWPDQHHNDVKMAPNKRPEEIAHQECSFRRFSKRRSSGAS